MTPLGWGWAAAVWVYALAWFLISDRIKLFAYRILDTEKKPHMATQGRGLPPVRHRNRAPATIAP